MLLLPGIVGDFGRTDCAPCIGSQSQSGWSKNSWSIVCSFWDEA